MTTVRLTKTQIARRAWMEEQPQQVLNAIVWARETAADAYGMTVDQAAASESRTQIAKEARDYLQALAKDLQLVARQLETEPDKVWGGRPSQEESRLLGRIEDVEREHGFVAAGRMARKNGVKTY